MFDFGKYGTKRHVFRLFYAVWYTKKKSPILVEMKNTKTEFTWSFLRSTCLRHVSFLFIILANIWGFARAVIINYYYYVIRNQPRDIQVNDHQGTEYFMFIIVKKPKTYHVKVTLLNQHFWIYLLLFMNSYVASLKIRTALQ